MQINEYKKSFHLGAFLHETKAFTSVVPLLLGNAQKGALTHFTASNVTMPSQNNGEKTGRTYLPKKLSDDCSRVSPHFKAHCFAPFATALFSNFTGSILYSSVYSQSTH
jgi:hypothetical protein